MVKEKVRKEKDSNNKDEVVSYEIIGMFLLFLSMLALTSIGKLGEILLISIKFFFGDWYWLVILFLIFYAIFLLIFHRTMEMTSLRALGIIFIILSLLLFSHFPVNEYLLMLNKNTIIGTFELYTKYVSSSSSNIVLGGGLIGGLIFTIFYFFLGNLGVKILAIILLLVGISFFLNKTLLESFDEIKGVLSKVSKVLTKYKPKVEKSVKIEKTKPKRLKSSLSNIEVVDFESHEGIQNKISLETMKCINNILNVLDLEYEFINLTVGYNAYVIVYEIYSPYDILKISEKMKEILDIKFIIKKKNSQILFEINNTYRDYISINKHKLSNIILGYDLNKAPCIYDKFIHKNMLISGDYNSGITTFLMSYIINNIIVYKEEDVNFFIFDPEYKLEAIKNQEFVKIMLDEDFSIILDVIQKEITKRLEIFKHLEINNYLEYEKKFLHLNEKDSLKWFNVIINGIENIRYLDENKLVSLIIQAEKVGITVIMVTRIGDKVKEMVKNAFKTRIVFKSIDPKKSTSIIGYDYGKYLDGNGDMYLLNDNELVRLQAPYIAKKEFERVFK